jgi:hypothetical protein
MYTLLHVGGGYQYRGAGRWPQIRSAQNDQVEKKFFSLYFVKKPNVTLATKALNIHIIKCSYVVVPVPVLKKGCGAIIKES